MKIGARGMEPNTMLPPDALCKNYGLRDEALDQLLIATRAREVTLQYRSGIEVVQEAFASDIRIRIIALSEDEEELVSAHLAWLPLWSNRDTCVLIADPLEPPCRHDFDYLIPVGFAEHFAHANLRYPYYLPVSSPRQLQPPYLDCQLVGPVIPQLNGRTCSDGLEKKFESTMFALTLEVLQRLRGMVADHLLVERQLVNGVVYNHATRLFEMALPELPTPEFPWLLSFAMIDAARSVATLANTDFLTRTGFTSLVNHARERVREFEPLASTLHSNSRLTNRFDSLCHRLANVRPELLRDSEATSSLLHDIFEHAGINSSEDSAPR